MSRDDLQKYILTTVIYYDGLDYPLTSFEIWKYLTRYQGTDNENQNKMEEKFTLGEVLRELEEYKLKRFIQEYQGFYFLKGRSELVRQRIRRNKISMVKIKKLRRTVWFLKFIPFVRMVGVTGRLAIKSAEADSDWDVLVVLRHGKIWTGRTLVTAILQVMGKRRHGDKIRDRVCLNYFVTDESLELATQNLYDSSEYFFIFPLFDSGLFSSFQRKNKWIRDFKLNYYVSGSSHLKNLEDSRTAELARKIGESIFRAQFLENWLEVWQQKKIAKNPKTEKLGSFVRATKDHLIFLPEPQGPRLAQMLAQKIEKLACQG
jgi:hypothetical protein